MPEDSEDLRRLQIETRTGSAGWKPAGSYLVPGLTVLYHPDVQRIGERVTLTGLASGREERLSRTEPAFSPPGQSQRNPLGDLYLSRSPIRLAPGGSPGSVRLLCSETRTTVAADGCPVAAEHELSAAEVERGIVLLLAERIVLLLSALDPLGAAGTPRYGLVGDSAAILRLRQEIRRVSDLDVPILLRGETGTGKELVARALHEAGSRRNRPYLAVNMGAVPGSLAAAELFGAARGAFTGADRKRVGYFSRAEGGTLFLDEIGETPPEVQVLLLRALENRVIQPVGGEEPLPVDVRLIAATDSDLEAAVAAGRFRAPLLHRLSGYEVVVPPMRQRRDDFGRLFLHFVRQELAAIGEPQRLEPAGPYGRPWIPAGLVARLALYDWPGNVRQLRNVVRQLVISGRGSAELEMGPQVERLFRSEEMGVREPPPSSLGSSLLNTPPPLPPKPRKAYRRPEEVSEEELLEALRASRWRVQPTAARLGISRTSLYDRIEKSATIRKASDLGLEEIEACRSLCGGDLDAMVERLEVSKRGLQRHMKRLGLA